MSYKFIDKLKEKQISDLQFDSNYYSFQDKISCRLVDLNDQNLEVIKNEIIKKLPKLSFLVFESNYCNNKFTHAVFYLTDSLLLNKIILYIELGNNLNFYLKNTSSKFGRIISDIVKKLEEYYLNKEKSDYKDQEETKLFLAKTLKQLHQLFYLDLSSEERNFVPLYSELYDNKFNLAKSRYGERIAKIIFDKIEKDYNNSDEYECTDNITFCQIGNKFEEQDYDDNKSCCGRWEETYLDPETGNQYKFGFNYGH